MILKRDLILLFKNLYLHLDFAAVGEFWELYRDVSPPICLNNVMQELNAPPFINCSNSGP